MNSDFNSISSSEYLITFTGSFTPFIIIDFFTKDHGKFASAFCSGSCSNLSRRGNTPARKTNRSSTLNPIIDLKTGFFRNFLKKFKALLKKSCCNFLLFKLAYGLFTDPIFNNNIILLSLCAEILKNNRFLHKTNSLFVTYFM